MKIDLTDAEKELLLLAANDFPSKPKENDPNAASGADAGSGQGSPSAGGMATIGKRKKR
jgi:hypothetical protein